MDRVRKELGMMVIDLDSGLPYSKHCIPCGSSFQTILILTYLYTMCCYFPRGVGGQVQVGAQYDGHGSGLRYSI